MTTSHQAYAAWLRAVTFCLPNGTTLDDYAFDWRAAWNVGLTPEEAVAVAEKARTMGVGY